MIDEASSTRAQQREHAEPSEYIRPIPLVAAVLTLLAVLVGAGYILASESFGRADLGDRRTLADLGERAGNGSATVDGKALFAAHCVACHQPGGKGLAGVFPPLDGSEWVNGNERVLANIVLHGVTGNLEVMGVTYNGSMPSFAKLSDAELAAVVSWVRSQWSNQASPVDASLFERERRAGTRTTPFQGGAELKSMASR